MRQSLGWTLQFLALVIVGTALLVGLVSPGRRSLRAYYTATPGAATGPDNAPEVSDRFGRPVDCVMKKPATTIIPMAVRRSAHILLIQVSQSSIPSRYYVPHNSPRRSDQELQSYVLPSCPAEKTPAGHGVGISPRR